MMTTRFPSLHRACLALTTALVMSACGGSQAANPTPVPTPIPTPAPTPEPTPEPTPTTSCSPLPPPVTRIAMKTHLRGPDYITLDSTPLVGPDVGYCARIGYTDGRSLCPVRQEGDPQRAECEAYAVGRAEDTGRLGPTWTRQDGEYCTTFEETFCSNHPDNQYLLWVYCGGIRYRACARNGACGEIMTDHAQHLERCIGSPGSTWPGIAGGD
jgi:hypothetical protein